MSVIRRRAPHRTPPRSARDRRADAAPLVARRLAPLRLAPDARTRSRWIAAATSRPTSSTPPSRCSSRGPPTPAVSRDRHGAREGARRGRRAGPRHPARRSWRPDCSSPPTGSRGRSGAFRNEDPHSDERRPSLVRRGFDVRDGLVRARLYATAHGVYEAELNGRRVGDDTLSPGWTVYGQRLRYYTYDVTDLVTPGPNAIGAWLGDGWYRGRLGWRGGFRNLYGVRPVLPRPARADLRRRHARGRRDRRVVEVRAEPHPAQRPVRRRGLRRTRGAARLVHRRLRRLRRGRGCQERHRDPATLVAPTAPPVRATQELRPVEVLTGPSGSRILDFGQNLVGRVRIRVSGDAGATVTLRTAEVMQDGEIYTRPLRAARSTDNYTLAGPRASRSGSRASPSTASATSR